MNTETTQPLQVDFELFEDDLNRVKDLIPTLPTKKVLRPERDIPEQYTSMQEYYTSVERLKECYNKALKQREKMKTRQQGEIDFRRFSLLSPDKDKKGCVVSHKDVYHAQELQPIIDKLNEHYPQTDNGMIWEPRGFFVYPPGGFMEWHTNEHQAGTRVYFTHALEGGKSGINFVLDNQDFETQIVESTDKQGWQHRSFFVGDGKREPANWHCIWSDTTRLSIGFGLIDRPWQRVPGALVS